jgi:hypothetical protein
MGHRAWSIGHRAERRARVRQAHGLQRTASHRSPRPPARPGANRVGALQDAPRACASAPPSQRVFKLLYTNTVRLQASLHSTPRLLVAKHLYTALVSALPSSPPFLFSLGSVGEGGPGKP